MTIYCDMDGVLCDFDIVARKTVNHNNWVSQTELCSFAYSQDFWEYLPWMPYGRSLWNLLAPHKPSLLSAMNKQLLIPTFLGKFAWIDRELKIPHDRVRLVLREDKQRYATTKGKPNFLVDDHERNIKEWIAAGGIGVRWDNSKDPQLMLDEVENVINTLHEPLKTITSRIE